MAPSISTSRSAATVLLTLVLATRATPASAQSCCAGSAAITPGRLLLHEGALVGAQLRAGTLFGSYQPDGTFVSPAASTTEVNLEQHVFGALRVLGRGQVALSVPMLETHRATRSGSEWGGGIGDTHVSARYDVTTSGASLVWPGVAILLGVTAPTGRPVDRAEKPLATDATGIGAWQGTLGVSLEQTFGPWLAGLTALAARRLPRTIDGMDARLATRWTLLATGALSVTDEAAVALGLAYHHEGNAIVNGMSQDGTRQHLWTLTCSSSWSPADDWRLHGGVSVTPPWSGFGANVPSTATLFAGVVRTWL